jgi:hypothetical protein
MSPRHDDGISFDRPVVHDPRVASGAAFCLLPDVERLHMLSVAHDQTYLVYR